MIKVFISQPVRGKTKEEILEKKSKAILAAREYVKKTKKDDIEIIDTYFKNYDGNSLQFLGKSIMEGLAIADLCVFVNGWSKTEGCKCEQFIAFQYQVESIFLDNEYKIQE